MLHNKIIVCFHLRNTGQERTSHTPGQTDDGSPDEWQKLDMPACKRSADVNAEHSKDGVVMELLQMYSAQHEKLQATLRKQKQLEKVITLPRFQHNTNIPTVQYCFYHLPVLDVSFSLCSQELQILRRGEVGDRRDLHGELEAVQSEHAQRLGEVQQEQRKLKSRLDQLRQQGCRCKDAINEPQQETMYAKQVPMTSFYVYSIVSLNITPGVYYGPT